MKKPKTLEQLQNRPTSYEVVVVFRGSSTRLDFTQRKTKSGLLAVARQNGDKILAMLGDWSGEASYTKKTGWVFGPVVIEFSGLTERDCSNEEN